MYGEDGEEYYGEGDYDDEEYGGEEEDVLENVDNDLRPPHHSTKQLGNGSNDDDVGSHTSL